MKISEKNLLVLASAGSGKTFRLSDRIIRLMASGAEPEKIVALTFTRKAAGEFADAILRKLAGAAKDPGKAAELEAGFGMSEVDFPELLEKVTRKLPRLTLGTMDSFFAKVVRGFQYELGATSKLSSLPPSPPTRTKWRPSKPATKSSSTSSPARS